MPVWTFVIRDEQKWLFHLLSLVIDGYAAGVSERSALPFAWWNTKVAPPSIKSSATAEHRAAVANVLNYLVSDAGCRLVALGEVRRENVLEWIPLEVRSAWDVLADTSGDRHDFDLAVLYDAEQLRVVQHSWVREYHAGGMVRAGVIVEFASSASRGPLLLVAAHWRSDTANPADSEARRTRAAEALRAELIKVLNERNLPVLILGDLNAEPYAAQFGGNLPAARSRDVVLAHRPRSNSDILLYNAAWRWIGERDPWISGSRTPSVAGTYRTDDNLPTAWRTVDQVLVSRQLLGNNGWSLREEALGVWTHDVVYDRDSSRLRPPFDHLPILGHLEWMAPDAVNP